MNKFIVILWILFFQYLSVLIMILADLWSGVRKARKVGAMRTSYGFRRTVEKVARYYNAMLALTVMDCIQIVCIWYMEEFYGYKFIMFPFMSLVGSIGISLIEFKSIYEKAEDKARFDDIGKLAGKILVNKNDLPELVKSVSDYMNTKKENHEDVKNSKPVEP